MCTRTWLLTLGSSFIGGLLLSRLRFHIMNFLGGTVSFFHSSAASLESAPSWRERPRLDRLDRASIHIQRFFRDVVFGWEYIGLESLYIKLTLHIKNSKFL